MWIVELALRRPYTFVVMSLLILITGVYSIRVTPKDIFPQIDIPIITVLWSYSGLSAEDMANRVTSFSEFSIANSAGDVQRIESQTLPGIAIIKVYFQPNAKVETAMAEITGISQTILRRMPPGTQPPIVVRYNASSVPILQMAMSSSSLTASQLYDFGAYRVRQQLIGVNGMRLPLPFGGAPRQIMVDLDMHALTARGLTPLDVSRAINVQNLVLPSGTAKIGDTDYIVSLNSNPDAIATLNEVPVKTVNGAIVRIKDVANVRDGYAVQTNVVRRDSQDSTLITFLKMGNASTLNVIRDIKARLPAIRAAAPPDLNVDFLFDQSRFVEAAIDGVVFAGAVAATLVAVLVMIFLASWRSTVIVATSIPLAVLTSLSLLAAMGQSLNVMTLGGLALAVGVLVDDAIVAIENIHRYLELGDPLEAAIRNGSAQIALPAFVSSLVIAIVFLPVLFLEGAAKFLFVPLGLAVVFAVGASYVLSRTLVPVMAKYLLPGEVRAHAARNSFGHRFQAGFERVFHAVQNVFAAFLGMLMRHRIVPILGALLVIASAVAILPHVGRDFFPTIDGGQFRLHVKTPTGTRLEETSRIFSRVEDAIREVIPAADRVMMIDNIGLPEGLNLAWGTDNTNIGMFDGEILVSLAPKKSRSTQEYMRLVRERLVHDFPALKFYYQPGDMTSQILNFGIPAPIDVQVVAFDPPKAYALAKEIEKRVQAIPGAVDVRVHQQIDAPDLRLNVDRMRAADLGLTQNDVASNVLIALSGSGVVTPNFWIDPKAGRPVLVAVQAPQHRIDSIGEMMNVPIASGENGEVELLSNAATIEPKRSPAIISRSDAKPVFDVYAGVEGRDLGSVVAAVREIVKSYDGKLPPAVTISVRGQAASMDAAFSAMGYGLIFAVVLVYLLLVVNFHSWTAPFVILTALPGALSGIVWMLYLSHTTFSVPALMGAIMTVGVATANSILVVSFANGEVENGVDARTAALRAATVRLRPVMITAAAMIVGMIPMALGIGEGGEQNAPLGRAVIGGLSLATLATLLFVPVAYSLVYRKHRGAEPLTAALVAQGAEE